MTSHTTLCSSPEILNPRSPELASTGSRLSEALSSRRARTACKHSRAASPIDCQFPVPPIAKSSIADPKISMDVIDDGKTLVAKKANV